jgi:hypothetical protein
VQIEFPWRVMFGTIITYAVAACFKRHQPQANSLR